MMEEQYIELMCTTLEKMVYAIENEFKKSGLSDECLDDMVSSIFVGYFRCKLSNMNEFDLVLKGVRAQYERSMEEVKKEDK